MIRNLEVVMTRSTRSLVVLLAGGLAAPAAAQDVPEMSPEATAAFAEGMRHYTDAAYTPAVEKFSEAYALDPSFVVALFFEGICYGNLGQPAKSDSVYRLIDPVKHRLSPYYQARLETQEAALAGDRERSLHAARRAAELAPGTKAVYNYAYAASRSNRPQEALDALLTLDPERPPMKGWVGYWSALGFAYHELGLHEEELAAARRARIHYPDARGPMVGEVVALAALGRTAELMPILEQSARATDVQAWPHGIVLNHAAAELRAHGFDEPAAEAYAQALTWYEALPPDQAETNLSRNWHGFTLYAMDREGDAVRIYRALAEENPTNLWYATMVGVTAARTDAGEARARADWLRSREPAYGRANPYLYRAMIHAALGEVEQGREEWEQAKRRGLAYLYWMHWHPALRPLWQDVGIAAR